MRWLTRWIWQNFCCSCARTPQTRWVSDVSAPRTAPRSGWDSSLTLHSASSNPEIPTQPSVERSGYGNSFHVFHHKCCEEPTWAQGGWGRLSPHSVWPEALLGNVLNTSTIVNDDEWLFMPWCFLWLGRAQSLSCSIASLYTSEETILPTRTERERRREGERDVYFEVCCGGKYVLQYWSPIFDQQDQGRSQQGLLHAKYVTVPMCI